MNILIRWVLHLACCTVVLTEHHRGSVELLADGHSSGNVLQLEVTNEGLSSIAMTLYRAVGYSDLPSVIAAFDAVSLNGNRTTYVQPGQQLIYSLDYPVDNLQRVDVGGSKFRLGYLDVVGEPSVTKYLLNVMWAGVETTHVVYQSPRDFRRTEVGFRPTAGIRVGDLRCDFGSDRQAVVLFDQTNKGQPHGLTFFTSKDFGKNYRCTDPEGLNKNEAYLVVGHHQIIRWTQGRWELCTITDEDIPGGYWRQCDMGSASAIKVLDQDYLQPLRPGVENWINFKNFIIGSRDGLLRRRSVNVCPPSG